MHKHFILLLLSILILLSSSAQALIGNYRLHAGGGISYPFGSDLDEFKRNTAAVFMTGIGYLANDTWEYLLKAKYHTFDSNLNIWSFGIDGHLGQSRTKSTRFMLINGVGLSFINYLDREIEKYVYLNISGGLEFCTDSNFSIILKVGVHILTGKPGNVVLMPATINFAF